MKILPFFLYYCEKTGTSLQSSESVPSNIPKTTIFFHSSMHLNNVTPTSMDTLNCGYKICSYEGGEWADWVGSQLSLVQEEKSFLLMQRCVHIFPSMTSPNQQPCHSVPHTTLEGPQLTLVGHWGLHNGGGGKKTPFIWIQITIHLCCFHWLLLNTIHARILPYLLLRVLHWQSLVSKFLSGKSCHSLTHRLLIANKRNWRKTEYVKSIT